MESQWCAEAKALAAMPAMPAFAVKQPGLRRCAALSGNVRSFGGFIPRPAVAEVSELLTVAENVIVCIAATIALAGWGTSGSEDDLIEPQLAAEPFAGARFRHALPLLGSHL